MDPIAGRREDISFKAPQNLPEQIAAYLGEKIIRLEMKPGEKIVETRLAEELGVSRSPLREALRILEKQQLVDLVPRRGARVSDITEDSVIWLCDVLKEILGLVAYRGVENRDEENFNNIRLALQKLAESAEKVDLEGYLEGSYGVAYYSCRSSKNRILESIVLYLWPMTSRVEYIALTQQLDKLEDNLRYFQEAMRSYGEGDAEGASRVIRALVENDKEYALRAIREGSI